MTLLSISPPSDACNDDTFKKTTLDKIALNDATLYDAVMALERAQEKYTYKHSEYRHRAVLVLDPKGKVVGKISQIDVLRALEPKYKEILEGRGFRGVGFSKNFLKSMLKDWKVP